MTCEEFRKRYHLLLDAGAGDQAAGEAADHMKSCDACAAFSLELLCVDRELRHLPVPAVPGTLVASLKAIGPPGVSPSPGWGPDIGRALHYLIPGAALWAGQLVVPESAQPFMAVALICLGTYALITSILRPSVMGSGG